MGIIIAAVGSIFLIVVLVLVSVFSFDVAVNKGFRLVKTGQFQKARELFEKLAKKKPQNYQVLWGLARSLMGMKYFRETIKVLKKIPLSETNKHNYFSMREFYLLFAQASEGLGEYHEAIKYLVYLTKHGYDTWKVNFSIADVFYKMREMKKSVHYLNIALEKNPRALPVLSRLGAIYYKIKNYTVSTNYLKKVLNLDKNNIYARIYLGLLYFQTDKYHETIKYLKDINPQKIPDEDTLRKDYWFFLGSAYFKSQKFSESYKTLRRFLQEADTKYEGWRLGMYRLALSAEKIGKFEESAEYWAELHRIGRNLWDVEKRYSLSAQYSKNPALRTFLFSSPENFLVFAKIFISLEYSTVADIEQISHDIFDILALRTIDKNTQHKFLIRIIRNFETIDKQILESFFMKMRTAGASKGIFYTINNEFSDEAQKALERFPIEIKTLLSFHEQIEQAFEEYKKRIS